MSKPHEQTWMMDRGLVVNEHGKGIFRMQGSAATPEAESLAVSAPQMARALLFARDALGAGGSVAEMAMATIEDALRAAKVIP